MPVVGIPGIYCPVCGHKNSMFVLYTNSGHVLPATIKVLLNICARHISFECEQCKTKLVYDRKKDIIKIKKHGGVMNDNSIG